MSRGLSIFLIANEPDALIFGCRRRKLLAEVTEAMEEEFESRDDQCDVENEGLIPHADALRGVVAGKVSEPSGIHGWAYEIFCSSMGDRLSNTHFCPCRSEWFGTLDQFFEQYQVPLRLAQLIGECPIALPNYADWPNVGHWSRTTMTAARKPLATALAAAPAKDIADALREVASWLEQAAAEPRSTLIGFYG